MAFAGLNRLIADTKWKAVAIHLNRNIFHGHVEDNKLMVVDCYNKAFGLLRDQAVARRCQDVVHRPFWQIMAGNGEVFIFNAQDKDATLGVCESGHILCNVVADVAARTRLLGAFRPLEQRFAFEMLAFVLIKKWRNVEARRCHRLFLWLSRYVRWAIISIPTTTATREVRFPIADTVALTAHATAR